MVRLMYVGSHPVIYLWQADEAADGPSLDILRYHEAHLFRNRQCESYPRHVGQYDCICRHLQSQSLGMKGDFESRYSHRLWTARHYGTTCRC